MRRLEYSHRPATVDDLAQVAAIEAASIRPPWPASAFATELEKKHSHFWVVTDDQTDENVYAYLVFAFPAEQAHIQTVAVHPDRRRGGLAKHLLRQVIAYVIRKGGESVILEVRKGNVAAIQLYQSLGFIVVHTLPKLYPDGEDAYVMVYKAEARKIAGGGVNDEPNDDQAEGETLPVSETDGKKNLTRGRAFRSDS